MPGPTYKPASRRSRAGSGGVRTLSPVPEVDVPEFPLRPDPRLVAELETIRDQTGQLQAQLAAEVDRRKRYRIKRNLDRALIRQAELGLQVEEAAEAERDYWAELWRSPQSVYWSENSAAVREVALYVRWMIRAEYGDAKASSEARALSNALGINPTALLRLRAEIEHADAAESAGRRRRQREQPQQPQSDAGDDPRAGLYAV